MGNNFLNSTEIAQLCSDLGVKKGNNKALNLLILGFMAGMFIAFAAAGSNMAASNLLFNPETYGVAKALQGVYFPVGLMLVVIGGGELFTGNTLMITSVLDKKITWAQMFRNWGIVYVGNFIGSMFIVYLVSVSNQFNSGANALGGMTIKIAASKTGMSFGTAVVLGILCNILVCMAVWLSYAAKDVVGKCTAILFVISLFVCSGYEHSIANMYYIPAGILAKANPAWAEASTVAVEKLAGLNWGTFLMNNLVPVTIGNIIGGCVFVGCAYWFCYVKNPVK